MPEAEASALPHLTFEEAEVGADLGRLEYTLNAQKLRMFRDAVGDADALFATIASKDYYYLLLNRYQVGRVLNAKHESHYFRPPRVGSQIRVNGRLTEKYIKRDRHYVVVESVSTDLAGELLVRSRTTLLLGGR